MTDWFAYSSALIAAAGLIFTGWQVMLANRQVREDINLALRGVVVSWRPEFAPAKAGPDGKATWRYAVTLANPGKFPIDHVTVVWHFDCDVERVRSDDSHDPATRELRLVAAIVPGGGEYPWHRALRMDYADASHRLPHTYAEVTFTDIKGATRTNRWPRTAARLAAA